MGQQNTVNKLWKLVNLEDRNDFVIGQYVAEDVRATHGSTFGEINAINHEDPILQWLHGTAETIEFSATFFADDQNDQSVEDKLAILKSLSRKREGGGPPVCYFELAGSSSLNENVLVELGDVNYMEPLSNGLIRGITIRIILHKYVEFKLEAIDPTKPEFFTRIRRVTDATTYESLAREEYGDALLGIVLRQFNPLIPGMDIANLTANDPVHMFPEEFLLRQPIEPKHHVLKSGPGWEGSENVRREIRALRQRDGYATSFADTGPEER